MKQSAEKMTYSDYLTWPEGERWELISGVAYNMSPAPSPMHQHVLGELFAQLHALSANSRCSVYLVPFDVRFPEKNEKETDISTVVQPDISIVCDASKIDRKGCKGAPDMVIEILSPATAKKDRREKFRLYQRHQVKSYWIVSPLDEIIEVFTLNQDGKYGEADIYTADDRVPVSVFPGAEIDLAKVFSVNREEEEE
ncbi:hypothetical protein U14_00008 [Candidatus Moduliflexus flocculans]|uniref:Putative restriction endonuclease domain-containing protein n=1 Tax=Candidatus Moduliflexus flocculans TaxID=1499966 RepID=A0A0S6VUC8_9BACT|nr:hypothetical protein U14_00008 [Candidatus Moduliflexus flocculans]